LIASGASRGRVAARKAAGQDAPGEPVRPQGKEKNWRRCWNLEAKRLLGERRLKRSDGARLASLCDAIRDSRIGTAEERGRAQAEADRIRAEFAARTPFAEAVPALIEPEVKPALTLQEFAATVAAERATFAERLVPGQTLTLDASGPYEWPDDDATAVVHRYCQDIAAGNIVAGELARRACMRHIDDMQHASERGFVWDVIAARNLVTWFRVFCGLELLAWEQFVICSVFAWKDGAGFRRFKEAWLSVARKSGKTALSAGVGLYGLVIDEPKHAEIYASACKKDQAALTFRDAVRMRDGNADLSEAVKKYRGSLTIVDKDSIFQPLSSDVRSADGTRPNVALCDEIHEWSDRTQFDKMTSGMVMHPNRLVFATTTAGDQLDGFCATHEQYLENVVKGIAPDDTRFVAIYRMEREWKYSDETKWLASNPSLGTTLTADALRGQLTEVENEPSALNGFLRFHCNQWVTLKSGHTFSFEKIDACKGAPFDGMNPVQIREWFIKKYANTDTRCFAGFDFGEVSDMCCAVILFPDVELPGSKEKKHVVLPYYFAPEDGLNVKEKLFRVPLSVWVREKLLTLLPGDICTPQEIEEHITELSQTFNVRDWRYDRFGAMAGMFAKLLKEHRVRKATELPQTVTHLTLPSKAVKTDVLAGKIATLGNPVLNWNLSNVALILELNGCMMPKKAMGDRNKKVDGVSALIDAYSAMNDPKNKLASPGIFTI
jgi:phage terminase large subunit-like protein